MQTTDIEKKSLETHVELCAERYKFLEEKLDTLETKVENLESMVRDIKDIVLDMNRRRGDQLLSIAGGIIAVLLGVVGWLVVNYVSAG